MTGMMGFWCYVHADDDVDGGRVVELAHDLRDNYAALTGESIEIFLDKDNLAWGDRWRDKVNTALDGVAFFIPVVTPRFLQSVECRREFQFFYERAKALGITQLLMPIHYINTPDLADENSADSIVQILRDIQYEPWLEERFEDRSSSLYRRRVHYLAEQVADRVRSVETTDIVAAAEALVDQDDDSEGDDEPGSLDRLVDMEQAVPRLMEELTRIGARIQEIGELMTDGTGRIAQQEKQGKGFAARLAVARWLAKEIEEPVAEIETDAAAVRDDLNALDLGLQVAIPQLASEAKNGPDELATTCSFYATVTDMSNNLERGLGAAIGMLEPTSSIGEYSKDLRPGMRRLNASLRSLYEAREVANSWRKLVDDAGLDCSAAEPEGQGELAGP